MADKFNSFYDSLQNGILGPKGNLADWQHASRLFVSNSLRLAPKNKFLFHCAFTLDPVASSVLPELRDKWHNTIGMLVKSADLPRFSATVETKNKYNRKKNIQTSITYDPVQITFHDDSYGVTTALLEAYYRYYYRDGNYGSDPGAYNKAGLGDNTYLGPGRNQYKFGLDNDISVPFLKNIQISQLSRKTYTTYTLVNPIITNWAHDSVDSADGGGQSQNTITVQYEAVFYDRGDVQAGSNGNPRGFGVTEHYDTTPSPISLTGGGTLGLGGIFGAGVDLYEYITKGANFSNPFAAGIAAANLFANVRNLSSEGLRQEGYGILTDAIGAAAGIDVSGVSQTFFPKNSGSGGSKDLLLAAAVTAGIGAVSTYGRRQELQNNPAALESAAYNEYKKEYQRQGGAGGINEIKQSWDGAADDVKQAARDRAINNA